MADPLAVVANVRGLMGLAIQVVEKKGTLFQSSLKIRTLFQRYKGNILPLCSPNNGFGPEAIRQETWPYLHAYSFLVEGLRVLPLASHKSRVLIYLSTET